MKILSILIFLLAGIFLTQSHVYAQNNGDLNNKRLQDQGQTIQFTANTEGKLQTVTMSSSDLLFNLNPRFDNQGKLLNFDINLKPELADFYKQIGPRSDLKTVFVYPVFTQAAYGKNGFYDYYKGKCSVSCLTISIPQPAGYYSASGDASAILNLLGYPFVTDVDVDKNPNILKQYQRVIVLHNEYVTKKEFDAITSQPDVIFLYPNALYAEVKTDYVGNTITLVRGHGYPDQSIRNGFDWQSDNSRYEYNVLCNQWTFYSDTENHAMLNCYPEYTLLFSRELLSLLQENDPTELFDDTANWLRYQDLQTTHSMLADFDINGTHVPQWVTEPGIMLENGEISKNQFLLILDYLYKIGAVR